MENSKNQQRYNQLINKMSYNLIKVVNSFLVYPALILIITNWILKFDLSYLAALGITLLTNLTINLFKRIKNGSR